MSIPRQEALMQQPNIAYMDNNATTATSKAVFAAMNELKELPLNASSIHSLGRKARGLIEAARENIAKLANSGNCRVIFTASGTESNNMALRGLDKYKVIVSSIEHASVLKVGTHAHEIPVNNAGIIDVLGLERLLLQYAGEKMLVSVMLANNETGVLQPIREIAEIVHAHGGFIHTDAAQCFGKITVDMAALGVDMLTISAHKFGGPQGVGALIAGKHVPLHSFILGGGQEQGYRAGTENIAAIHGFGVAALESTDNIKEMNNVAMLRDKIESSIKNIAQDAVIFGNDAERLPNTSMIAMPNITSQTQIMHFDMEGIAVSSGSACSSGKVETSHVLLAMGVAPELAKSAIRISLGINNTARDADKFINAWKKLYERVVSRKAA